MSVLAALTFYINLKLFQNNTTNTNTNTNNNNLRKKKDAVLRKGFKRLITPIEQFAGVGNENQRDTLALEGNLSRVTENVSRALDGRRGTGLENIDNSIVL